MVMLNNNMRKLKVIRVILRRKSENTK